MPVMLRPDSKARKIAYKIMGIPANIKHDQNAIKNAKKLTYLERPYFYGTAR